MKSKIHIPLLFNDNPNWKIIPTDEKKGCVFSLEIRELTGETHLFDALNSYLVKRNVALKAKDDLFNLLNYLDIKDFESVVYEGLKSFKDKFVCRPIAYYGDEYYYKMLEMSIMRGNSLKEASFEVNLIIDREMKLWDVNYAYGCPYRLNFF